jgi:O-antigen ligase
MPALGIFCLLALPWLNPFTFGPVPAVVPWLFTMACAGAVLGFGVVARSRSDGLGWERAIAGAWLLAALISAVIGLVQYFGASAALAPWVNGTGLGEAYGNLRQRNQFATLMAIGMAALTWWVTQGFSWRVASVVVTLLAFGSAASSSRTGLLQWVLYIVLASLWQARRRTGLRRVLLVAALAYAVGTLVLPWLAGLDPLNTGAWARMRSGDEACMGRLTLWSNVLHLIAQKPWFGWGWGGLDYAHFVTLYPGARFCDILDNAHNLPLHLAVELGVPISLAVCSAGLWVVLRARPWSETDPTRQMAWAVLALIGLHSLLEYPLWYGPFQIAGGLSIWLLWGTAGSAMMSSQVSERLRSLSRVWPPVVAIFLAASCAYAAWDYWRISQLYMAHAERASNYRENTLEKLRGSWLFKNQVQFAELTTLQLTPDNAAYTFELAQELLQFSPEPRVIEKLIESGVMLGRNEEAAFYLARYRSAFPESHAQWIAASIRHKAP